MTHFLPLPLFVPIAEFDLADQWVGCSMSDGKTRHILVNGLKMFTKTFPQSAPGLASVNGRAGMAGDAVNQTRGQTVILLPRKNGFRWKYDHKYGNVGVDMDKYLHVLQPTFCHVN